MKIRSKDLKKIGFTDNEAISIALQLIKQHFKWSSKQERLEALQSVLENPADYAEDERFTSLVTILNKINTANESKHELIAAAVHFEEFGKEHIESGARKQMDIAMRLPITVNGALMPDAHVGYGLPIGGVLAADNAVIPYGVGVDIGCRMSLSIYPIKPSFIQEEHRALKQALNENSRFGKEVFDKPMDDEILYHSAFQEISTVRKLKDKAAKQIGSSGSGNHFVEFGKVVITDPDNEMNLPLGQYLGLLTHSGSRGLGATIAQHYTRIAKQKCALPREAQNLAWLDLDSEAGIEYWVAMNLAGEYASACHRHIHQRMSTFLAEQPLATVENHHNFAWKEQFNGRELIVHRKGATPAGKGVLGVIPGSMTMPGFIVRGKGSALALNSASHGAGRQMSRKKARESITRKQMRENLKKEGVTLIGGGVDEAPIAYKNIHSVMASQRHLVDVLGQFEPKIVRMDN